MSLLTQLLLEVVKVHKTRRAHNGTQKSRLRGEGIAKSKVKKKKIFQTLRMTRKTLNKMFKTLKNGMKALMKLIMTPRLLMLKKKRRPHQNLK